jgi:uncharacterized membrane protein
MQKYSVEIKWSLILGGVFLVWMFIEKGLGFHGEKAIQEPLFNLLFLPILAIIFFLALKEKKNKISNKSLDWKEGFASGIILTLLASVTTTFVIYLTFIIISPDFFETAISQSKDHETAQLNFNFPIFIKNNIFDKLSFGVVFSAIMSYFLKTK